MNFNLFQFSSRLTIFSDCGVFAIAFAVCLALGTNPAHVTFDTHKMHPHFNYQPVSRHKN